ncbi:MAG: phosphopantetheine-binding protein, partial [Gallionella sp.]
AISVIISAELTLIITNMSSLPTIQRMMVEQFDLKIEDLTPDATLESLGLDSLSVIEFMFNLEDELKIKLPDERVEIKTLQDVINLVDRVVAEQSA